MVNPKNNQNLRSGRLVNKEEGLNLKRLIVEILVGIAISLATTAVIIWIIFTVGNNYQAKQDERLLQCVDKVTDIKWCYETFAR